MLSLEKTTASLQIVATLSSTPCKMFFTGVMAVVNGFESLVMEQTELQSFGSFRCLWAQSLFTNLFFNYRDRVHDYFQSLETKKQDNPLLVDGQLLGQTCQFPREVTPHDHWSNTSLSRCYLEQHFMARVWSQCVRFAGCNAQ